MTLKRIKPTTGGIYHVFNRTIAKTLIFNTLPLLNFSLKIIDYYRFPQPIRFSKFRELPSPLQSDYWKSIITNNAPLVEIYSYSLMPNHHHFLLKQQKEDGINRFISNLQNSFAKNFNGLRKREGRLFYDRYKAKQINSNEEFIHVSRYIHLNPVTAYLVPFEQLKDSPLTSYQMYYHPERNRFVNTQKILSYFNSLEKYDSFLRNQVDYQRKLNQIKHLL